MKSIVLIWIFTVSVFAQEEIKFSKTIPRYLYHWTDPAAMSFIGSLSSPDSFFLPLLRKTTLAHVQFFNDSKNRSALFTWSNPLYGMAAGRDEIYGDGKMLLRLEISPDVRVLRIRSKELSDLQKSGKNIDFKKYDLIEFIGDNKRNTFWHEWIVVSNRGIVSVEANPIELKKDVIPFLKTLKESSEEILKDEVHAFDYRKNIRILEDKELQEQIVTRGDSYLREAKERTIYTPLNFSKNQESIKKEVLSRLASYDKIPLKQLHSFIMRLKELLDNKFDVLQDILSALERSNSSVHQYYLSKLILKLDSENQKAMGVIIRLFLRSFYEKPFMVSSKRISYINTSWKLGSWAPKADRFDYFRGSFEHPMLRYFYDQPPRGDFKKYLKLLSEKEIEKIRVFLNSLDIDNKKVVSMKLVKKISAIMKEKKYKNLEILVLEIIKDRDMLSHLLRDKKFLKSINNGKGGFVFDYLRKDICSQFLR